jgi:hypothetical protein
VARGWDVAKAIEVKVAAATTPAVTVARIDRVANARININSPVNQDAEVLTAASWLRPIAANAGQGGLKDGLIGVNDVVIPESQPQVRGWISG